MKIALFLQLIFPIAMANQCLESLKSSIDTTAPDIKVIQEVLKSEPYQRTLRESTQNRSANRWKLLVTKIFRKDNSKRPTINAKVFLLLTVLAPSSVLAQQSLFNVPSIVPAEKDHFFFQEQINVLPTEMVSNTTLDYGLGDGWSAGLSLYNLKPYSAEGGRAVPDTLFNLEKVFKILPNWDIGVGTQTGIDPQSLHSSEGFLNFSYVQNRYIAPNEWGEYYVGYYYANKGFLGEGNRNGFMLGYDVPIIDNKLRLMGDYISGTNEGSVAVLGLVYVAPNDWHISLGAQIPASGSHNDFGFVLEITKIKF